ncbi:MAG TPA: DUF2970 domain-containing protein [Gammaproteobacteria bacterium]|nr:DUF2970 domain-containing protein [Gammaproteobacteria bacterium]
MDENLSEEKLSTWAVAKSVAAAFFGVQSMKNRERDFKKGSFGQFLFVGALATLLFILVVWGAVLLALKLAGV